MIQSLKVILLTLALYIASSSGLTFTGPASTERVWGGSRRTEECRQRNEVVMMPIESDRPTVKFSSGPAVLDRPAVEEKKAKEPTKERKSVGSEAWEVRIYNDGMNTREHVARCLVRVTGLSEITAYETMMQAHQHGIAVVGRWIFERAEMYYDALKKHGIICDLVPVDEEK